MNLIECSPMKTVHLSRIDLNLFVVFDAIYTEGGITRASKRLNLTQPAISHALARLRELFDDPLFVRQGQAMIPTPLARATIDPVRQALQGFATTLRRADHFDPATARKRFTVGMRDLRELTALPNLLHTITHAAPFIDITTDGASTQEPEGELAAGTLDAAVDVHLALSDQVQRQRLNTERLIVVARPRHPAAKRGLDLDTYLSQEHILVSSRRRGLGVEDYELSRHGLKRRIRLRCEHYFAACRVVSETARSVLRAWQNAMRASPIDCPQHAAGLPSGRSELRRILVLACERDADPANRWLRNALVEAFRERRGDT